MTKSGAAGDIYNTAVNLRHVDPDLMVDYITGIGTDGISARNLQQNDTAFARRETEKA